MKKIAAALAAAGLLALTACSTQTNDDNHGVGDAPPIGWHGEKGQDSSPKIVTGMPDGYPNVATSCVANGFRTFVTTWGDTQFIVLPDASCKGFMK